MITTVNGSDFERMFKNALANLKLHEQEINDLNVFPVPDGDTGTNMRLTLENGLRNAPSNRASGAYLKALSDGMLRGARGNSGVILSQLVSGLFQGLCHDGSVNAAEFRDALVKAYKTAYAAVVKPVEGTVLTVSRVGIERIRTQIDRYSGVDILLSLYISEMKKALASTPKLLPVLKEAGVVDSGAVGYITIVEGMLMALRGEMLMSAANVRAPKQSSDSKDASSMFNAYSPFTDGYCLEFTLQLMRAAEYRQSFRRDSFVRELSDFGESIAIVTDGDRIKIHIHTMRPEKVIALAREYGEFVAFKLENMQLQHSERNVRVKKEPRRPVARIAVVNGAGAKKVFSELGCEIILDGGRTMNTSAQDFLEAFERANADKIIVLPDNKNIEPAARQAAKLYSGSNIEIIPTEDIASGYYALAMDVADSDDFNFRVSQMKSGIEKMTVFSVAEASKDASFDGISITPGQSLAFRNGKLLAAAESPDEVIAELLSKTADEGRDFETFFIFCSDMGDSEALARLQNMISDRWPLADVSLFDGGQPVYRYIIGAV